MKTKIWVATFNTGTHGVLTAVFDHEPSDEEQAKLWPEEQIQASDETVTVEGPFVLNDIPIHAPRKAKKS
jgi:hypothetical protein